MYWQWRGEGNGGRDYFMFFSWSLILPRPSIIVSRASRLNSKLIVWLFGKWFAFSAKFSTWSDISTDGIWISAIYRIGIDKERKICWDIKLATSLDARWKFNAQSKSWSFGKEIRFNEEASFHVSNLLDIIYRRINNKFNNTINQRFPYLSDQLF